MEILGQNIHLFQSFKLSIVLPVKLSKKKAQGNIELYPSVDLHFAASFRAENACCLFGQQNI